MRGVLLRRAALPGPAAGARPASRGCAGAAPRVAPHPHPWWRRPRSAAPRGRVGHGHDGTHSQSHQVLYQGEHRYCGRAHARRDHDEDHRGRRTGRGGGRRPAGQSLGDAGRGLRRVPGVARQRMTQEHPCSPSVVADQNERDELLYRDSPAPSAGLIGRSAPRAVVDDRDRPRGVRARRSTRRCSRRSVGCRRARRSCSPPRSQPAPGRRRPARSGRAVPAIGAPRRAAVPIVEVAPARCGGRTEPKSVGR